MAAAKLQMKNLLKPLYIKCEEIDSSKYAFYEAEKKSDLERRLRELGKSKKDAEDSVDKIKTKAYLLMKRNIDSPPARDIWEETFVRVVSDYVEKCYIEKEKPDQEDKDELNMKLFPIGFGIEYYMRHES